MVDDAAYFRQFEELGEDTVLAEIETWEGGQKFAARKWLESRRRADSELRERAKAASMSEQIEIARSAKNAAWTAAMAAIAAAIIATIGAVISVFAWLRPHG